jgi:RNA polymerase subunit RPABC4/transcription elongation factor Spt4
MVESKLRECSHCDRLVNCDVNCRCPKCGTPLTDTVERIEH